MNDLIEYEAIKLYYETFEGLRQWTKRARAASEPRSRSTARRVARWSGRLLLAYGQALLRYGQPEMEARRQAK